MVRSCSACGGELRVGVWGSLWAEVLVVSGFGAGVGGVPRPGFGSWYSVIGPWSQCYDPGSSRGSELCPCGSGMLEFRAGLIGASRPA